MEASAQKCDNQGEVMNVYGYNGNGYFQPNPAFQPPEARPMQPMPMQPPMQQQRQQAAAQPTGDPGWIMVQSVQQVEQVSVQPGQKAWIMVQNEPVFAFRAADNMGLTETSYYHFEKFDPKIVAAAPAPEYVTRQEFQAFVDSLRAPEPATAKKEATAK